MAKESLIHASDFESVQVEICFQNMSSQTIVSGNVIRIGGGEPSASAPENMVQLLEIADASLIVGLPQNVASLGHAVELDFRVKKLRTRTFGFTIAGIVKELEFTAQNQVLATIFLQPGSLNDWRDFCEQFSKKQGAIDDFFKNVRGY